MRKAMCILVIIFSLVFPKQALAAGFTLNIQVIRQDDGTTCGELWYNGNTIWRVALLNDGAKPVNGSYNTVTTFIAPDVINGLFLIKVQ